MWRAWIAPLTRLPLVGSPSASPLRSAAPDAQSSDLAATYRSALAYITSGGDPSLKKPTQAQQLAFYGQKQRGLQDNAMQCIRVRHGRRRRRSSAPRCFSLAGSFAGLYKQEEKGKCTEKAPSR